MTDETVMIIGATADLERASAQEFGRLGAKLACAIDGMKAAKHRIVI